ncbi:unnamed protein product [Vitrella brassicaformis CCMP3155]|uniref:VWFA domain-containing protein n=3 Tax=Vitrella brassicaformis TaxID=1169539 RepID=A0A0G4FH97_VITBC|nr:unnamed protein product [Vitrella brassicaformis CCMP3155]|eukprot:CEM12237.1 unnamed protein product [Vitrella brassicaformis CCMP3155]
MQEAREALGALRSSSGPPARELTPADMPADQPSRREPPPAAPAASKAGRPPLPRNDRPPASGKPAMHQVKRQTTMQYRRQSEERKQSEEREEKMPVFANTAGLRAAIKKGSGSRDHLDAAAAPSSADGRHVEDRPRPASMLQREKTRDLSVEGRSGSERPGGEGRPDEKRGWAKTKALVMGIARASKETRAATMAEPKRMRSRTGMLESVVRELQEEQRRRESEIERLYAMIEHIRAEKDELVKKEKMRRLEKQEKEASLAEEYDALLEEINELRSELNASRQSMREYKEQAEESKAVTRQLEKTQNDLYESRELQRQYENRISELQRLLERQKRESQHRLKELHELRDLHEQEVEKKAEAIEATKAQALAECEGPSEREEELEEELEELRKELDALTQKHDKLENENLELKAIIEARSSYKFKRRTAVTISPAAVMPIALTPLPDQQWSDDKESDLESSEHESAIEAEPLEEVPGRGFTRRKSLAAELMGLGEPLSAEDEEDEEEESEDEGASLRPRSPIVGKRFLERAEIEEMKVESDTAAMKAEKEEEPPSEHPLITKRSRSSILLLSDYQEEVVAVEPTEEEIEKLEKVKQLARETVSRAIATAVAREMVQGMLSGALDQISAQVPQEEPASTLPEPAPTTSHRELLSVPPALRRSPSAPPHSMFRTLPRMQSGPLHRRTFYRPLGPEFARRPHPLRPYVTTTYHRRFFTPAPKQIFSIQQLQRHPLPKSRPSDRFLPLAEPFVPLVERCSPFPPSGSLGLGDPLVAFMTTMPPLCNVARAFVFLAVSSATVFAKQPINATGTGTAEPTTSMINSTNCTCPHPPPTSCNCEGETAGQEVHNGTAAISLGNRTVAVTRPPSNATVVVVRGRNASVEFNLTAVDLDTSHVTPCITSTDCGDDERCVGEGIDKGLGGVCVSTQKNCSLSLKHFTVETLLPAQVYTAFRLEDCRGTPISSGVDFRVEEDGRWDGNENEWYLLQNRTSRSFVLFLVDMSGSARASLNASIPTITRISLQLCRGAVECALYAFDGRRDLQMLIPFSQDDFSQTLARAIVTYRSEDISTNLYGSIGQAIRVLEDRMDEEQRRHESLLQAGAMILFSDGKDLAKRRSRQYALHRVQQARRRISFFSVAVPPAYGSRSDPEFLQEFGRGGAIYQPRDNHQLQTHFKNLFRNLDAVTRSYYIIGFCSALRNDKVHTVTVRAKLGEAVGSASGTFSSEGFTGGCRKDLLANLVPPHLQGKKKRPHIEGFPSPTTGKKKQDKKCCKKETKDKKRGRKGVSQTSSAANVTFAGGGSAAKSADEEPTPAKNVETGSSGGKVVVVLSKEGQPKSKRREKNKKDKQQPTQGSPPNEDAQPTPTPEGNLLREKKKQQEASVRESIKKPSNVAEESNLPEPVRLSPGQPDPVSASAPTTTKAPVISPAAAPLGAPATVSDPAADVPAAADEQIASQEQQRDTDPVTQETAHEFQHEAAESTEGKTEADSMGPVDDASSDVSFAPAKTRAEADAAVTDHAAAKDDTSTNAAPTTSAAGSLSHALTPSPSPSASQVDEDNDSSVSNANSKNGFSEATFSYQIDRVSDDDVPPRNTPVDVDGSELPSLRGGKKPRDKEQVFNSVAIPLIVLVPICFFIIYCCFDKSSMFWRAVQAHMENVAEARKNAPPGSDLKSKLRRALSPIYLKPVPSVKSVSMTPRVSLHPPLHSRSAFVTPLERSPVQRSPNWYSEAARPVSRRDTQDYGRDIEMGIAPDHAVVVDLSPGPADCDMVDEAVHESISPAPQPYFDRSPDLELMRELAMELDLSAIRGISVENSPRQQQMSPVYYF